MANLRIGRRSGLVLRGCRNRRSTLWSSPGSDQNTLAAANTAVLRTSLTAAGLALRPFTVIRVRGVMLVFSDQEAASETQEVAFGTCVVSDQASAIGVTAVPTPHTDAGSDKWQLIQDVMSHLQVTPVGTGPGSQFVQFDTKAMRKVEEGSDFLTVLESSVVSSGLIVQVFSRQLFKLH